MRRAVLLAMLVLPAGAVASAATIEGRVSDDEGRPVSRVQVTLSSLDVMGRSRFAAVAHTDKQGQFRFDDVSPGRYVMVAEKKRWMPAEQSVVLLRDDQRANVSISLSLTLGSRVAGTLQLGGLLYVFAFGMLTFYFNFSFLPEPSKTVTAVGWAALAATVVIALVKLDVLLAAAFALCGASGGGALNFWGNRRAAARRTRVESEQQSEHEERRQRAASLQDLLGQRGMAQSNLNPYGDAQFDGRTVEVKSSNGFIARSTPVVVQRIEGRTVVVEPVE